MPVVIEIFQIAKAQAWHLLGICLPGLMRGFWAAFAHSIFSRMLALSSLTTLPGIFF